jgi:hypothetical protein
MIQPRNIGWPSAVGLAVGLIHSGPPRAQLQPDLTCYATIGTSLARIAGSVLSRYLTCVL